VRLSCPICIHPEHVNAILMFHEFEFFHWVLTRLLEYIGYILPLFPYIFVKIGLHGKLGFRELGFVNYLLLFVTLNLINTGGHWLSHIHLIDSLSLQVWYHILSHVTVGNFNMISRNAYVLHSPCFIQCLQSNPVFNVKFCLQKSAEVITLHIYT